MSKSTPDCTRTVSCSKTSVMKGYDFPIKVITLKPGEVFEGTAEVHTPGCYNLKPGKYSIRFNYNLRALEDDSVRTEYEKTYGHPKGGIVPWDGRDHPFNVVKD